MIVDLEHAEIQTRVPLGSITSNRKRNRQGDTKTAAKEGDFDRERRTAISCIRTMFEHEASPSNLRLQCRLEN